jgi:hypothetical protein
MTEERSKGCNCGQNLYDCRSHSQKTPWTPSCPCNKRRKAQKGPALKRSVVLGLVQPNDIGWVKPQLVQSRPKMSHVACPHRSRPDQQPFVSTRVQISPGTSHCRSKDISTGSLLFPSLLAFSLCSPISNLRGTRNRSSKIGRCFGGLEARHAKLENTALTLLSGPPLRECRSLSHRRARWPLLVPLVPLVPRCHDATDATDGPSSVQHDVEYDA